MKKNSPFTDEIKKPIPSNSGLSRRQLLAAPAALLASSATMPLLGGSLFASPVNADGTAVGLNPRYYPLDIFQPEIDLRGKLAVITGASRGIGQAIATQLSGLGVDVFGTSRNVSTVPNPPTDYPLFDLDICDPLSVEKFTKKLAKELRDRPIDMLINNAGRLVIGPILLPPSPALSSYYFHQLQLASDTLYHGHVRVTQALLPFMPTSGYARLLFTVSSAAYVTTGTNVYLSWLQQYVSAKRALLAYANSLRSTFVNASSNIIVSTVNPYTIGTTLSEHPYPIYTYPVGADGYSNDSTFNFILDISRQSTGFGLPPSYVGVTYLQLLTSNNPPPNVVVASNTEPFKTYGGNETLESLILDENAESAIPFSIV